MKLVCSWLLTISSVMASGSSCPSLTCRAMRCMASVSSQRDE